MKRRLLAFLLVLVLAVSVLPINVMADEIGGEHGGEGDDIHAGTNTSAWAVPKIRARFVRFTVVGFPNGIENWNSANGVKVYGKINLTDSSDIINLAPNVSYWFNTNAISANYYEVSGQGSWQAYYQRNVKDTTKGGEQAWKVESFQTVVGKPMPDVSGINSSGSGAVTYEDEAFLKIFTDVDPTTGERLANEAFDKLIKAATGDAMDRGMFIHGEDPLGTQSHIDYRLVIEPGTYTGSGTAGKYLAMTARDMIAWNLNHTYVSGACVEYIWWNAFVHLAYGLYNTREELWVPDSTTDSGYSIAGTPMFEAVSANDIQWDRKINKFKSGHHSVRTKGYGMAIINPGDLGDVPKPYTSYIGRTNIYMPLNSEFTTSGNTKLGIDHYTYIGNQGDIYNSAISKITDEGTKAEALEAGERAKTGDSRSNEFLSEVLQWKAYFGLKEAGLLQFGGV